MSEIFVPLTLLRVQTDVDANGIRAFACLYSSSSLALSLSSLASRKK